MVFKGWFFEVLTGVNVYFFKKVNNRNIELLIFRKV